MATPSKRPPGDNGAAVRSGADPRAYPRAYPMRQPSRWARKLVLLALVLGAAAAAWSWGDLRERARVASAFGARTGCVCRFVSQRPLKSCEGDLNAAGLGRIASLVSLSEDPARRSVSAGVPLLARQTASFREDTGCLLEPWED